MAKKPLLVIQAAALGYDFLKKQCGRDTWHARPLQKLESLFPALTCPAQASVKTGTYPQAHGMVLNGIYSRELRKPRFWEQSSALVSGKRIWEQARASGKKAGLLFWQQSLGEDTDMLLSPAPVHTHGGGLVEDVFSKPEGLYKDLTGKVGSKFKLSSYWGPLASVKSTQWISKATLEIMDDRALAPDILFVYLPHLDYCLQKCGPDSDKAAQAFSQLDEIISRLLKTAETNNYDFLLFGDYTIAPVSRAILPNKALAESKLFKTRTIKKRLYPDFHYSKAFAVCDHEIAHVYIQDETCLEKAAALFNTMDGIEKVHTAQAQQQLKVNHKNSGELVLTAAEDCWFSYQWWDHARQAPDYATHVDIHNKPGYDPCELFFGRHPFAISQDTSKVKGSHGKAGPGRETALISSLEMETPAGLPELGQFIKSYLE